MKTLSYLHKLILFGFFLSALPTIIIGSYSYVKSSKDAQAMSMEMNRQMIQQTRVRIEQVLEIVDRSLLQFSTSPLSYSALNSKLSLQEFQLVWDLYAELSRMQLFELGISDISFVNLSHGWIINNSGKKLLSELPAWMNESFERYMSAPTGSFWSLEQIPADSNYVCTTQLIKKLPIHALQTRGLLIAQIPCSYFSNQAASIVTDGYFFIVDEDGQMIATNYSQPHDPEFFQQLSAADFTHHFSREESAVFGKRHYMITYQKSVYNQWTYMKATPMELIYSESRTIGWATFFVVIGILIVCLSIAALASRKLYGPIKSLYQILRKVPLDFSTTRKSNEMNFIMSRITHLLDDRSRMVAAIESQIPKLNDYFSYKLIHGGMTRAEISERLSQLGYPSTWKQFIVLAADIDTLEGTSYRSSDLHLLMFAINNIVSEVIPDTLRLRPVLTDQAQITIVGDPENDQDSFKVQVGAFAEKIQQTTRQYLKLQVSIGISRLYRYLDETPIAYRESLEALKYRIRFGGEEILFIDELEPKLRMSVNYPETSGAHLIDMVKFGDEAGVEQALDSFIEDMFRHEGYPWEYQVMLTQFLHQLTSQIYEINEIFDDLFKGKKSVYDRLFELSTKQEIESWLRYEVIEPIVAHLERKKKDQSLKISQEMIKIIHEQYGTPLTLESVAEQLNYHPNYIRRVFRQQTGENFSDYLTNYRMMKVKQWLVETDMKISEIAERVNYQNAQNLIRSFRKLEGMTPGAYRTLKRK